MTAKTVILICGLVLIVSGIVFYFASGSAEHNSRLLPALLMVVAGGTFLAVSRNTKVK